MRIARLSFLIRETHAAIGMELHFSNLPPVGPQLAIQEHRIVARRMQLFHFDVFHLPGTFPLPTRWTAASSRSGPGSSILKHSFPTDEGRRTCRPSSVGKRLFSSGRLSLLLLGLLCFPLHLRLAKTLHERMVPCSVQIHVGHFPTTPVGRLLGPPKIRLRLFPNLLTFGCFRLRVRRLRFR